MPKNSNNAIEVPFLGIFFAYKDLFVEASKMVSQRQKGCMEASGARGEIKKSRPDGATDQVSDKVVIKL